MKYACLVHFDGAVLDTLDADGKHRLDVESVGYDGDLAAAGHLIVAQALQSPGSAVLVRVRDGRLSATDGPFSETKEQLGGFILIEARDMNEAIRLAGGIPLARLGTIEVRPVYDIPVRK
ncbi:YciI family protein [Devosia sp.]|uniref:YciI family protein n=1 Tax=Devosia sp. TaxID=1871048 RepID=UPI0035B33D5F